VVICLEQGANLHTAQLMPLPLTVSCFSEIQIGFTFLVPAHPGSPDVCMYVCVCNVGTVYNSGRASVNVDTVIELANTCTAPYFCCNLQVPERHFTVNHRALHTHTHVHLTALYPGLHGWAGTRKVKPIRILLEQETVSGSGISWAIRKSAPRSRQITTSAPSHSRTNPEPPIWW